MLSTKSPAHLLLTLFMLFNWHQSEVFAAKILALVPMPSPSHHIWNRSLMLALAARGHHVTVVSPDPEKQPIPKHKDIVLEGIYEYTRVTYDFESFSRLNNIDMVKLVFQWGSDMCNYSLTTQGAKQLMKLSANETFDLIIFEVAMEECFLGFVHLFGYPPVIGITAFGTPPWANSLVGNPDNPSYISGYLLPYTSDMNFSQRMANFLQISFTLAYRSMYHIPEQDKIVRQHFGDSIPSISELEKNISLLMVNQHHSLDYPRPMVPAMIPVGGIQLKPAKLLPKDIQTFLDGAKEGAIYFSLGSNLRSDEMKPEKRQAFLDAFSELPQRILWKWESDSLPGQPKNVKIGKWLPQNDILAHPNVRLFITHSGLLSTQEAFYNGVPVVGMPFMADQHINIEKLRTRGLGEKLDYSTVTKEVILNAIQTVLNNPSYKEKMKQHAAIFRDQTETPLERAVYWTEYVIRHNGAHHLRSAAVDLPLYQYLLLDVIGVLVLGIVAVLAISYLVVRTLFRAVVRTKKNTKSKQH